MSEQKKRCMVCGKPMDVDTSICQPCNDSIKGEAVGKQKKMVKTADKQIMKHGQKPPK
jgi:predicted nucleic acid-binding Zn ribbon protein